MNSVEKLVFVVCFWMGGGGWGVVGGGMKGWGKGITWALFQDIVCAR